MIKEVLRRRRLLARRLARRGISTYVASSSEDIFYLSAFAGEDSALVVSGADAVLVSDSRFDEQAHKECLQTDVVLRESGLAEAVRGILPSKGKIGYDPDTTTVSMLEAIAGTGPRRRFQGLPAAVRTVRQVKSEAEIAAIETACRVAIRGLRKALRRAGQGTSERRFAGLLETAMHTGGARGRAFETIVLVDERASLPHGRPGSRPMNAGSSVLVDWGAQVGAYNSDLTRVLAVGTLNPTVRKLYRLVRDAQERAIERIKPGVRLSSVDEAAREVIARAGYGAHFGHALGHGVGLEVHELPVISGRSKGVLRQGMVFSVEPGIYLPGEAGVRLEDLVVVTADGCRRITNLRRDVIRLRDRSQ